MAIIDGRCYLMRMSINVRSKVLRIVRAISHQGPLWRQLVKKVANNISPKHPLVSTIKSNKALKLLEEPRRADQVKSLRLTFDKMIHSNSQLFMQLPWPSKERCYFPITWLRTLLREGARPPFCGRHSLSLQGRENGVKRFTRDL